jgi:hypothetical protein
MFLGPETKALKLTNVFSGIVWHFLSVVGKLGEAPETRGFESLD